MLRLSLSLTSRNAFRFIRPAMGFCSDKEPPKGNFVHKWVRFLEISAKIQAARIEGRRIKTKRREAYSRGCWKNNQWWIAIR